MDINGLKNVLKTLQVPEVKMQHMVQKVAHWTKKIGNGYETIDPAEVASLRKIAELGILTIESDGKPVETITVHLNEQGKELSKDFFLNAYYVK